MIAGYRGLLGDRATTQGVRAGLRVTWQRKLRELR